MSVQVALARDPSDLPLGRRLLVRAVIALARLLALSPPRRVRALLERVARTAPPAGYEQARQARAAVVAMSTYCAGEGCLPRTIATALLCRLAGRWPTWRVGVRLDPFAAHAWVEADGLAVDEPFDLGAFRAIMTVYPRRDLPREG